ncbi:MAG: YiiX/YebB-like N1pC/P60 family cysteine hydrolase [Formosimonas sp.]
MSHLLDLQKLKLGDIILQAGDTKISGWIKAGTRSDYSHAMIYVGNSIIHALTDGVYSINPQRVLVASADDLVVLRARGGLNSKQESIITGFSRNLSGSIYNIAEAGASLILNKSNKDAITSDQFCSRLVAQSYLQAGLSIVKNADYCSPEDIHKSNKLEKINSCTKLATEEEVLFAKSEDPIKENQRRMFEWLNKTRVEFVEKNIKIQSENDVLNALAKYPELDSKICGYVKESGYLEHFAYDRKANPHRYSLEDFIAKVGYSEMALEFFLGEIKKESGEITRHSISYFNAGLNFSYLGLIYSELNQNLYKNLLGMSLERLEVLLSYAEQINQPKLIGICNYQVQYIKKLIK